MAISDKLNYLIETKQLFKDRLNSLGAEITSSTTFRNYLTWLDTFYGEVSDKTDISTNGVVGRTSQDSTTGANLMPVVNVTKTTGGIEVTNNGDGTLTLNGTATAQVVYPITNTGNNTARIVPVTENDYKFMLYGDTNVSNDTYFLQVLFGTETETTKFFAATNNGATSLHIATDRKIGYALIIRNGQSFNNHIIKPMGVLSTYTGGFEPYTGNQASPNPDYPQPINNLSGDVAYKVSEKNLFQSPTTPSFYDNATYNKINDNSFSLSYTQSTSTNNSAYVRIDFDTSKLKPNTEYTISKINKIEGESFSNIGALRTRINGVNGGVINSNSLTFTTPSIMNNVGVYFYVAYQNTTTGTSTITFDNIQLEENSIATDFEPYIEPQTFNIPLGDIELCKIGDYQDRIYKQNDKWYLEKQIGKVVLDGSEDGWIYISVAQGSLLRNNKIITNAKNDKTYIPYSNNYKGIKENSYQSRQNNQFYLQATTGYLDIIDNRYTNENDFKTWLSTHNTIVYYVLATPTTTEITQENYPSLYNALKQIQDYLTAYKINKEFILGYSSPESEY